MANEAAATVDDRIKSLIARANRAEQALKHWNAECDLRITCFDCAIVCKCSCAFDPYNTNGDCLAEK